MADNGTLDFEVQLKMNIEEASNDLDRLVKGAEAKGKNFDNAFTMRNTQREINSVRNGLNSMFDDATASMVKLAGSVASFAAIKKLGQQVLDTRDNFQKLEIAFGTMLGSADKANKLMTQLTETAARTPFDLDGIASGAKQLLAYGIAADDVNDKIVQMGDIAAGLSIPLGDLVYLYGTTVTQGQMFTQDLRQFQGRGIPIAEELAKVMGVTKNQVSQLVTEGKITSDVFIKAFDNMTAAGSKFGGLMEAQSSTIGGQIANIQDAIDMMFNDIGKSSEGFINTALSGVSFLVENYKPLGTAILALAGTYGTYKAALVIVSAVEKAHAKVLQEAVVQKHLAAASNIALSTSDATAAARKVLFSAAIKANTKAVLANTAALLTNPAVLITAGLVALCATIYAVSKALDTQARAQEAVNKKQQEQQDMRDKEKSDAEAAIQTIQSETASIYDKAAAYEQLKKVMPELTNQYDQAAIAAMDFSKAQSAINNVSSDKEYAQAKQNVADAQANVAKHKKNLDLLVSTGAVGGTAGAAGAAHESNQLAKAEEELKQYQQILDDMEALRKKAEFDAKPIEFKIEFYANEKADAEKALSDLLQQQEAAVAKARQEWEANPLNKMAIDSGLTFDQAAAQQPALLGQAYYDLAKQIEAARGKIQSADGSLQTLTDTAGKQAQTLPQLIASIRQTEQAVDSARNAYAKNMSDANKKGLDDAEKTLKSLTDQYQAATNKAWVTTKEMYDEIKRLTEQVNKEELDLQKSRTQDKMKLIDMELQQTIAAINKEKAAYQEKYGKGADTSQFDRRIDIAQQGAADQRSEVSRERGRQYEDLAADADKFQQNQEIAALKEQANATTDMNERLMLQAEIRQRLLNIELDQLNIERQRALEDAGDDEAQKQIINQTYDQKEQQVRATSDVTALQEEANTLEQRKAQYEAFAQRTVEIEQQRIDNIKKIDEALAAGDISEATATEQKQFVETQASQETEQASIETLGTNVEGLGEELNAIMQDVLNQGLLTVQAQLPTLKAELASLKNNKNADPKQLAAAMTKVAAAEKVVNNYTDNLGTSQKEYGKSSKDNCAKAAAAMKTVGEAVDIVADNFGEFMGEAGQDAMNVIQTVVSASTTALAAISATAITSAEGVKTAEKASVILAIISAAIQVVMALVNVFAKYFSKAAQTQALIDKNNEAIEESKNRVKELQAVQKGQAGRDYWKNQWEQIAEYNKQAELAAENEKLAKQKKEESNTKSKKKDADEQAQEAHQAQLDAQESAREAMEEFYEEMSGTSLKSFSENLADSIVEGFKSGTEEMSDIWDDALDEMFTSMIKQQINLELQSRLSSVFDRVHNAFADGDTTLTESEIQAIKDEYDQVKGSSEAMLEQYKNMMEELGLTTDDSIEASSGGFESMSQDTADELNGRFTALQMSGASIDAKMQLQIEGTNMLITQAQGIKDSVALMVGIATNQLEELRDINAHTALLAETNQRLKQIQLNTDKL